MPMGPAHDHRGVRAFLDSFPIKGCDWHIHAIAEANDQLLTKWSDRFLLASLATEAGDMAMAWDEVRVLMEAEIECQALPESMRAPGAPIKSYVHLDGEIALYTSADRVMAFAFDSRG